jgi:hypothetical protein
MSLMSYRAAPSRSIICVQHGAGGAGGVLLSRALRRSTIGAEGFHGRVRDGIGWIIPRCDRRLGGPHAEDKKICSEKGYADGGAGSSADRFLRKEVIQPQVPLRLPCYDFTPVADLTVVGCLLAVSAPASGKANSHGVTGGVYKARERIHRGVLIRDY